MALLPQRPRVGWVASAYMNLQIFHMSLQKECFFIFDVDAIAQERGGVKTLLFLVNTQLSDFPVFVAANDLRKKLNRQTPELHKMDLLQQKISLSASLCVFSRFEKAEVVAVHGDEGMARNAEISGNRDLFISASVFVR